MGTSFCLFDSITESHVYLGLEQALKARGHQVNATGPVWQGHKFPSEPEETQRIRGALEDALALRPDVLFNFRASALTPEMLDSVRKSGVTSIVWLPDDPVLYKLCYKDIVDSYDIVLHCGPGAVLDFYAAKGHRPGINFPFWTSQEFFPYCYAPQNAQWDMVFLGNCRGRVRGSRYDVISSLPFNVRIFGRVDDDPYGLHGGYIHDINNDSRELTRAFRNARMGLSIPQIFTGYAGSDYDFPELGGLGFFPLPSRIIQYAASGLPILSLQPESMRDLFPDAVSAPNPERAVDVVRSLLTDGAALTEMSRRTNTHFNKYYSSAARALVLEAILADRDAWARLSSAERARFYLEHPAEVAAPAWERPEAVAEIAPPSRKSLNTLRRELRETRFKSPSPRRVLSLGGALEDCGGMSACIVRALENLGHDVLHFDLGVFPFVDGKQGLLDFSLIEPHLRRFCPDLILDIDGGVSMGAEDASTLKRRGVLFASLVMTHRDVQRLHAASLCGAPTEALLEACRRAGAADTILFPFAVDQAYACADVPPAGEYAGDVTAVPGSGGTPGHRGTMRHLADKIEGLKLYKEGWGAEELEGLELMQALRETRIHVEFSSSDTLDASAGALTSIANGGVVCAPDGSGLEKFFSRDKELVPYSGRSDLTCRIVSLRGDGARMEAIGSAAFSRLAEEHLYEHRLLSFFKRLEPEFEKLGIESRPATATRRVVISGYYGAGNIGDELILRSITQGVAANGMECKMVVAGEKPDAVMSEHSLQAVPRRDVRRAEPEIAKSTALILGGGGLWHDHSFNSTGGLAALFSENSFSVTGYSKLPLLAKIYAKAFHVYGMGVGPLKDSKARQYVRFLGELADSIVVRDETSAELLRSTEGWRAPVEVVPDVVYALDVSHLAPPKELREFCAGGGRVLGVNLRPWKEHNEAAFVERMTDTLDRIHEAGGVRILGIPFQTPHDNKVLRKIFSMLPRSVPSLVYEPKGADRIDQTLGALKCCDLLLSMRLHATLVAHRMGVPGVGLSYAPKVAALFEEVGSPELCLPLDARPAIVLDTVSRALADIAGYRKRLQESIPPLEDKARQGLELLRGRILEAAPPARAYVLDQESAPVEKKISKGAAKPAPASVAEPAPLLCLPVDNKDLSLSSSVWQWPANAPGFRLEQRIGALRFTCQNAEPCYLKQDARSFNRPPGSRVSAKLEPDRDYILVVDNLSTCGAEDVILYVMEYAGNIRVQTTQGCMASPRGMLRFHTTPSTDTFRVAIRFSGTGIVELRDVRLFAPEPGE